MGEGEGESMGMGVVDSSEEIMGGVGVDDNQTNSNWVLFLLYSTQQSFVHSLTLACTFAR